MAHPLVDQGLAELGQANFEASLETFAEAAQQDDLSRDELLAMLEAQAMAHLALDDQAGLTSTLRVLVAVDPEHQFSPIVPPEIQDAFVMLREDEEGGGVELNVTVQRSPSGAVFEASATPSGVVREIEIFVQNQGATHFERHVGARVRIETTANLEYYARAIGPGGIVLDAQGDESTPLTFDSGSSAEDLGIIRRREDDGAFPWLWVGIGAAALVGVAVLLFFVLAPDADVQPGPPMVEF